MHTIVRYARHRRNALATHRSQYLFHFFDRAILRFRAGELPFECIFHCIAQRTCGAVFIHRANAHVEIRLYAIAVDDNKHRVFANRQRIEHAREFIGRKLVLLIHHLGDLKEKHIVTQIIFHRRVVQWNDLHTFQISQIIFQDDIVYHL